MQTYLAHELPTTISYLLIIAVALWGGYKMLIAYIERQPIQEDEPRYPVDPSNAANLLAAMPSLRTDLPQYRNQTPPASTWDGDWEDMR